MSGVGLGTLATLGSLHVPMPVMAGIMALLASGAFVGTRIAHKVGPTELPQTVAAFHSLVGVAALGTAMGDAAMYLGNPEVGEQRRRGREKLGCIEACAYPKNPTQPNPTQSR